MANDLIRLLGICTFMRNLSGWTATLVKARGGGGPGFKTKFCFILTCVVAQLFLFTK